MAKQLNVNLAFTADTSQAKAQLQSLQTSLTQLISSAQLQDQGLGISKELQHSITLSSQLKSLLAGATNMETGKLDLGKFNEGLQKSGTSLQTYSNALNSLGVQGQQAFSQLASSILQAELPLKRSNALLGQFMTTLKNTAKWQISSSLLHGFIGTVKSAYGYAQDLNESLNNIRIVTGQNVNQMAKFAEKANQAAKALSTSTTEYTNASLIYYQQGLTDAEVQERTDITIKMANVSRQSAEIVSDQMTAVWNNFYDGGKSLEYYADVMTALGAATASSSDEIAGGLEKFAAIGETIGLSYEYAASALATITANTRQSEEVVGTALKTIFARIQGLKLGETLEDGVDLNKYSEALQTIGISIFEQNGELKNMDNILNEMGAKWNTLSKAQQTALAQTVAGVRQYNQLISLMDHWDDMQKNLDISYNAEGALQEQADTYAESWEAASKRVKASAEGIYQTLLNDKFFIGINNVFAELLQLIDNTIDSFGGLPGVLFMLGSVITSVFGTQITQSFDNFIYRIKMSTEVGKQSILQLRQQANDLLITNNVDMASTSGNAAANAYRQQGIVQNELIAKAEQLSEIERQQAQYLLDGHSSLVQQTVDLGILVEQEERRTAQVERSVMASARAAAMMNRPSDYGIQMENVQVKVEQLKNLEQAYYELSTVPIPQDPTKHLNTESMNMLIRVINNLEQEYGDLSNVLNNNKFKVSFGKDIARIFTDLKQAVNEGKISAQDFNMIMDRLATSSHTKIRRLAQVFVECGMSEEEATREAQRLAAQYDNLGDRTAELTESQIRLNNATNNFQNFLQKTKGAVQTFGSAVTVGINALSSFGMMMMSIKGIVDTLNNTEMSFGDKFITIFTQMTFLLPSVLHTVTQLTTLFGPQGFIGSMTLANSVLGQYGTQLGASINSINLMVLAKKAEKGAIDETTTARLLEKIMIKTGCDEKKAEQILEAMLTKGKHLLNAATAKEIALEIAKKAIKAATNPIMLATVAITAALTAAVWAFVYASQAEERALQAAKESVDNTARAYEDAENAVTKFKETASNYTEAIKGMKDLAYGTAEYAEKLREANDAAIELIKNNPELKYDVQGGLIQFEGGMNALESLEKQLINKTYNAKMFNINAEIEYENLLKPGKIESELEKLDVLKNEWIDIPTLRGMGNEFIKKLGSINEAEKQGVLNSNEAIKNILKNSGWEAPGYSDGIDEFIKRINNLTPAEKQDLINLSTEINKNTIALQAETAAILQEEYGQKNVDQYGEAEVYATKSAILDERASTAWAHEDHQDKKVGFAQFLDDDLDWGNNISNLSKENQELLAKVMGKSVEDIANGEIRISDDKVEVSTGKDASNTMLPSMSVEDFNKAALNAAGQATVTWEEIEAKLKETGGVEEAQEYAKQSGLYSADDLTIHDDSSFSGLTVGTTKALTTKFTDENGEVSGALNEYFDGLDNTVKKRAAERLLQLDTTNLNAEQLDSTVKEITEKEAQQYREQQAKTELQTDSAKYELDYSTTEKQMGRVKETLQDYNKELEKNGELGETVEKEGNRLSKGYGNLEKSSKDLTVANQRMNRGIATLSDNFKDWSKALKSGDKTTLEYTEAMEGMKEAFADIYNVTDSSLISDDFIENMDPAIMQQIADGNVEAIEKMRMAMADDIVANIILNNNLTTAKGDTVTSLWQQAKAELDAMGDLTVGTHIEGTSDFVARLNEMIEASGMTKDQVNSLLGSMGMSATLHTKHEEQDMQVPTYTEHYEETNYNPPEKDEQGNIIRPASWSARKYTVPGEPITVKGFAEVVSIETKAADGTSSGGGIDIIGSGKPSPSNTGRTSGGGGGGGGGGDKPKVVQKKAPIKPKKEKDEIERYHEISKAIEDQERVVDRLSKAKDKAYGANKLKAIDNEIAALQKLNELDSQHLKQIREKLALDRKAAAEEHGITFDEFGRINNYEEIIKQKMEWWRTEQQKIQDRETEYEKEKNYNEEYDADGAIKLKIDQDKEKIDEQYENFKEAITQYEETYSLFEDTVDKMQDQFDQMAEKAIEKITYEVEFKVEFEESAIDLLDFQIELLGEDFDAFAEIASITMEKTTHLSKALQAQSDGVGALYEAYDKGAISLDQFVENMKESLPDILSSMQNMISLDKEMMEYYSKAFDAAEEKFTEYLDFIDSGISKLDHFQNMLSLIGKEQNYDMLGVVLESQYTSASHRLQASSDWYETTKKEYDALYNRWIAEKNLLGPKELEMLEEKLKVARTKMQEADEQRLSDLEAVGEKAQEILQNNLNMARKKFEENLVGSSLEDYMNELDRLSKKQEEYLTNTNKMYETNKLIRQAQMEMDKTDNNRAKQQYNDYVKYIEQLQETGKLSSYELSVAQAKYELLQAQIALEEAKDAKDQVRLTRDSEGNYGYVYTANEDKVSDAEQAVADAENKLYNIGLDGAQDYQSKKAEILQEAIDTFASIEEQYQTGQIKTEAEFNAKMEEAKQYYYNRLKEYDNLYYMALGVMQEESYGNTIDYELDSRNVFDTFATHVDGYLGDVEQSFTDYNNKVGVVKQEVGDDLEAMRKKTEEVTKETEKLTLEAEKLTDQINNELLSVREATSIWGAYRDELYKNIEANKTLIEQLRTIQELQGGELADYSSFISDQVAKGKGYDDRLIQEALSKRWLKMEGVDNYDYTQKKIDYVQEYADLNGLTFEEAETALQDDAWYKTLGILRQYKIERTDWAAKKKEILEKDPKADVSWIDNIIAEKLSYDWAAKIQQYIERNPGLKYDDEYLQEMLTIRQIKIDSMKDEDKKDILSNDDLLAPYIEKGKLIDDRKSVSSAVSAATGGYTGEWGPEGKIAILHEKELILNAQDTQNFLSAVEILREINGILDQNALVASLGAINMQALSLNSLANQVLQQEVTIHADFPNVTDHNEIELAIDNLINAASQHAYRI